MTFCRDLVSQIVLVDSQKCAGPRPRHQPRQGWTVQPRTSGPGLQLAGAEFKAYYPVTRQFVLVLYVDCTALNLTLKSRTMSIEFIYIMPLLVNDRVETTLI